MAFPEPGWSGLAWIAPGLVLAATLGASPRRAFRLGYFSGFVHGLISVHWLVFNPFPAGAVAGWLALSAYLALYPAVWVWLCHLVLPASSDPCPAPDGSRSGGMARPLWVVSLTTASWARRVRWGLVCAAVWVALEIARARLLTGFPWNMLGVSQQPALPLIQVASVTGVYGVSFLVVWGSLSLLCATARLVSQVCEPVTMDARPPAWPGRFGRFGPSSFGGLTPRSFRLATLADIGLPLAAVLLLTVAGGTRLMRPAPAGKEAVLALVQPSIPQRLIFDPLESTNRFEALMKLTELALAARPDLLVWPEASLPSMEMSQFETLTNTVARHGVWMVFGADDAVPKDDSPTSELYDYFNSAFLFDRQGRYVSTYRKCHLVVFGEYIPLERWLPFMRYLTPLPSSFTPGQGPVRFELDDPRLVLSCLICFEDVVPHLVRRYVEPDTDFLLNLTNDAWFGESSAQRQHAANAAFRAVENGLPLVRCTNNGLTCWIDAFGRLRDAGLGPQDDVYAAGFKVVRVPLLPEGRARTPTLYRQYGDWFGWACVLLTGLALVGQRLDTLCHRPGDSSRA